MKLIYLFILVLFAGFSGLAHSDPDTSGGVTRAGQNRISAVEKLVESSSAALKIESSSHAGAKVRREEARALLKQARTAHQRGAYKEVEAMLKEATTAMFEAARMVEGGDAPSGKKQHDYQARLESIRALSASYERISQEKAVQSGQQGDKLYGVVQTKMAEAEALRQRGKLDAGHAALDEAYAAVKVALEQLRGGETLVRSLHFETKEEEYQYEVDRNDTHKMLVKMLLKDKMTRPGIDRMVQQFMGQAVKTRAKAEAQAAEGNFEAAVRTMEESTREIVRAIRSAGVYIPG